MEQAKVITVRPQSTHPTKRQLQERERVVVIQAKEKSQIKNDS